MSENATAPVGYFSRAIRDGIALAMRDDPNVVVMGEDVVRSTVGATRGLAEEFGPKRVRNTPISEAAFVGMSAGAAMSGLRPLVDLGFSSFLYVAMDQVANQIARLRYMSGGQVSLPLVIMAGTGPAGSAAAQHSENPHPMLMHIAGLKVVYPSTPANAKGLILTSIRVNDPVVYLFDLALAGAKGPIPSEDCAIPFGTAEVCCDGSDVTLVAVGGMVPPSVRVALQVREQEGISVEVIDPRTLVPMDWVTIRKSVLKTKRLVVVDPARRTCGAAAEIIARATEELWEEMTARPRRVTWADVPIPLSPRLEEAVTITEEDIREAIFGAVGRGQPLTGLGRGRSTVAHA